MVGVVMAFICGAALTLFGTPYAIRVLVRLGWRQVVRADGPTTHQVKKGTPTKGGLIFILATVLAYGVAHLASPRTPITASGVLTLAMMVAVGALGFADDHLKISRQNSGGLAEWQKLVGQIVIAIGFGLAALLWPSEDGSTPASFMISLVADIDVLDLARWGTGLGLVLAIAWFAILTMATTNATNFTDGLDGLLPGAALATFGAYLFIFLFQSRQQCDVSQAQGCFPVRDPLDLAVVAAAIAGSLAGYLWWSTAPAAVFMGDTGSMALGGAMVAMMIMSRTELLFLVLGALYVAIAGSSLLQRYWFKLSGGKRLFRMAPLHHHFELKGWAEQTVTFRFWIVSVLAAVAGVGIFYLAWVVRAGLSLGT